MQLVINTRGAFIRKKNNNFFISADDKKMELSPKKVSSILISTSAAITTDAIYLAIQNNIEIVLLSPSGKPYARIWHCKHTSTSRIRRLQLQLDKVPLGLELAKQWVRKKIEGRLKLIRQIKKRRKGKEHIFNPIIEDLKEALERLDEIKGVASECRGEVMGVEGRSGRSYFEAISYIMPSRYKFHGRSLHPAKDPFNAMLNYAYGVLYGRVESACIIAGLDPYIGILHTDNYSKLSLVYDIIEMFRPWAEETVIFLFTGRKVKDKFFKEVQNGVMLIDEGKELLISSINDMFEKVERYRKRNLKRKDIIRAECHHLANTILNSELSLMEK